MKTIVFDFDGTLADTRRCILATLQATLKKLQLPPADEEAVSQAIGLPLRENFRRGAKLTDERTLDQCAETYRQLFPDICRQTVSLFPHVVETLKLLQNQGKTLTIATSRGRDSIFMLLRQLGIDGCFSVVVAEEDSVNKKPAPDMVLHIMRATDSKPEETLVVGDTTFDIEMGRRAGCPTCGVGWGNHSTEQLRLAGADHLVADFAHIADLAGKP